MIANGQESGGIRQEQTIATQEAELVETWRRHKTDSMCATQTPGLDTGKE